MHTRLRHEIQYLARMTPTVETCGFAVLPHDNQPRLFPCVNLAADPTQAYQIGRDDWVAATRIGRILWVYHSHPVAAGFSEADLSAAEELTLPQWLYSVPDNRFYEHVPASHRPPPLQGRQFTWGEADCFTLLRDFARARWGIQITDYPRDETTSGPELGKLVLQQVEAEGFEKAAATNVLRVDDVLVFRTNGSPQHFGIFRGRGQVLHHPLNGLSRTDGYSPAWQRRLQCVCRFKGKVLA